MNASLARKIEQAGDSLVSMAAPQLAVREPQAKPKSGIGTPSSGRCFPPRKGAKRRGKDTANQWQRYLQGHGPSKTARG